MNDHTNAEAVDSTAIDHSTSHSLPRHDHNTVSGLKRRYRCLHEAPPPYPDHLSHNSSSSGSCPDAIPTILTPLRTWLCKRVSMRRVRTGL